MLESDYKKKRDAFLNAKPTLGQSEKDWNDVLDYLRVEADEAMETLDDFDKNLFGGING